jgi:hypothetical protein
MLAEMRIPPNYGPLYAQKFQATFGELAKQALRDSLDSIPVGRRGGQSGADSGRWLAPAR